MVKLYVEGGGHKALNRECRKAFGAFLASAGVAGRVEVEACGPRGDAYKTFSADAPKTMRAVLLVDAEGPVTAQSPWQHLQANDGWSRPQGAADSQCHLMVQVMESWFLADPEALEGYYGQGYRSNALPPRLNVEQVSKQDVLAGLDRAARNTGKGGYEKGKHGFEILATLDPAKVRSASPHADRFINALSDQGG